jgi:hypothetical protein
VNIDDSLKLLWFYFVSGIAGYQKLLIKSQEERDEATKKVHVIISCPGSKLQAIHFTAFNHKINDSYHDFLQLKAINTKKVLQLEIFHEQTLTVNFWLIEICATNPNASLSCSLL